MGPMTLEGGLALRDGVLLLCDFTRNAQRDLLQLEERLKELDKIDILPVPLHSAQDELLLF